MATYTNDGDTLNAIREAGRLIFCVLVCHSNGYSPRLVSLGSFVLDRTNVSRWTKQCDSPQMSKGHQ